MRPESVRESFQRLYPVRIDTMHSRPVTHDDVLLLYVEARRLMNMIGGASVPSSASGAMFAIVRANHSRRQTNLLQS